MNTRRDLLLARLLATMIALGLSGLGLLSIVTGEYVGHTSKYGGADVHLQGRQAVLMGCVYITFGCLPLALWWRTARAAGWWAAGSAFVGAVLLFALLYC